MRSGEPGGAGGVVRGDGVGVRHRDADVVEALEKEFSKRHGGDLEAAGEAADEDVVGDLQEAAGEVQRQARTE